MDIYVQYQTHEMELFWNFIAERHLIYVRKELNDSLPPWTNDSILENFKFTNVFRELDRGTRFVTNHILTQDMSPTNMIFNVIAYRLFNRIETYLHHGTLDVDTYDADKFNLLIHDFNHLKTTKTVFTSAFIVSGYSMDELRGMDKIKRLSIVFKWIRDQLVNCEHIVNGIMADTTMENTYNLLRELTGLGPFLGYQIAVDLSYWSETQFGEDDFVVMGPGAKHGIDWLFPEKEKRRGMNEEQCCIWMRDKQFEFWDDYNIDPKVLFEDRKVPYLTLMALENLCCEFQKYMKAHTKGGRPRNTYKSKEGHARVQQYRENEPWNTNTFSVYDKPQNIKRYKELIND